MHVLINLWLYLLTCLIYSRETGAQAVIVVNVTIMVKVVIMVSIVIKVIVVNIASLVNMVITST